MLYILISQSLVHVSTAYANCHIQETYEELYPTPINPSKLVSLTETLNEDELNGVTPSLIKPRPNTYTYTKAVSEHTLGKIGDIPYSIVRPSIGEL